jgi:hypothetical protein
MRQRRLGKDGPTDSVLGYGTLQLSTYTVVPCAKSPTVDLHLPRLLIGERDCRFVVPYESGVCAYKPNMPLLYGKSIVARTPVFAVTFLPSSASENADTSICSLWRDRARAAG